MTTQIQQQQVQGLVEAISAINTISGVVEGNAYALAYDLAATGYFLNQMTIANSSKIKATGVTLSAAIVRNTNLINATGDYFSFLYDSLQPWSAIDVSGAARYANLSLASNFRLDDYVLQTSLTGIPTGTIKEASSVCYNPSGCTYLVLSPKPYGSPSIKEFEFGGTGLVRSTQYEVPAGYRDVEGITHVLGNQFALCSEYRSPASVSKDAILLFDYIGNSNLGGTIPTTDFTVYDVGSPYNPAITNAGLEGISYNPQTQVFYGAVEGNDSKGWKVIEIKLGLNPETTTGELFRSGTVTFSPPLERLSDIYYDPNSKHLFLTDHGDSNSPADRSRVFECDLKGNLIDYVDLKDSRGNNYNQIEGITFSPDGGRMVIAGEAKLPDTTWGSDLGYYTTSSFATSGVYRIPAMLPAGGGQVTDSRYITEADHGTIIHCGTLPGTYQLTLPTDHCSGKFDGFQCEVFVEGTSTVVIEAENTALLQSSVGSIVQVWQFDWAKIWCITGMWNVIGALH